MNQSALILYVKTGCPWCAIAQEYLDKHRFRYECVDVREDRAAFDQMRRVSGQTYAPTLVSAERVLSDFGLEELVEFLRELESGVPEAQS
jgi:glutaredoxin